MELHAPRARTHNEDDYRELLTQVQALQKKLSTKTEALLRLGHDVEEANKQKELWKAKATTYERNLERAERQIEQLTNGLKTTTLSELHDAKDEIQKLKEENTFLKLHNDDMKAEIKDFQKDCKTFRQQLARAEVDRIETAVGITKCEAPLSKICGQNSEHEAETINKIEKLSAENKQLSTDISSLLSAKEELILERDAMAKKIERLSTELTYLLNGDPKRVVEDLDSLMAENRYLKAQLNSAQEESQTIKAMLEKYRCVAEQVHNRQLEEKRQAGEIPKAEDRVAVVNMKQIRELLTSQSIELDESDYRALTNVLLDVCNDKQMMIAHQRRANKILGNRLYEVEQKLQAFEMTRSPRNDLDGVQQDSA